jgi:MEMO1 family protein
MTYPAERMPAHAGTFFPAQKSGLDSVLSALLPDSRSENASKKEKKKLRALIVPHAGYVYSAKTAAAGYSKIQSMAVQPKNFILLGPSHHALFAGIASCSFSRWKTPLGLANSAPIEALAGKSEMVIDSPDVFAPEHCLEVQVPFLQKVLRDEFCIYPALTSETDAESAAEYLAPALGKKGNFLVVSSDLSHFLSQKEAVAKDSATSKVITSLDLAKAGKIDACGKTGIVIAMVLARKFGWACSQLDYSTSFGASGDGRRVVGYGCYAFYEKG